MEEMGLVTDSLRVMILFWLMVLSELAKLRRPNSFGVFMLKVMVLVIYDLKEEEEIFYKMVTFTSIGAVEAGFLP